MPTQPISKEEQEVLGSSEFPAWLASLRDQLDPLWQSGVILIPLFTDHGLKHSQRIATNVAALLDGQAWPRREPLNTEEREVLMAGIYLHDIGMQCTDRVLLGQHNLCFDRAGSLQFIRTDPNERLAPLALREIHHTLSREWLESIWNSSAYHGDLPFFGAVRQVPKDFRSSVASLCFFHSKEKINECDEDAAGKSNTVIRLRLLAAILRLGDELDTAADRVDVNHHLIHDMPVERAKYHWVHYLTFLDVERIKSSRKIQLQLRLSTDERRWYKRAIVQATVEDFHRKNAPIVNILTDHGIFLLIDKDTDTTVISENRFKLPPAVKEELDPVAYHLDLAFEGNGRVPYDAMTDKVFTNVAAAEVTKAWEAHQRRPALDPWLIYLEYGRLLRFRGTWANAVPSFEQCLKLSNGSVQKATVLVELGTLQFEMGRTSEGTEQVESALELLKLKEEAKDVTLGPQRLLGMVKALKALGNMLREGLPEKQRLAEGYLNLALGILDQLVEKTESGYIIMVADCLREQANVYCNMGQIDRAQATYEAALNRLTEGGDPLNGSCEAYLVGVIKYQLGKALLRQNRLAEAQASLAQARNILDGYTNDLRKSFVMDALGTVCSRMRIKAFDAERLLEDALRIRESTDHPHLMAYTLHALAQHLLRTHDLGRLPDAERFVGEAIRIWVEISAEGGQPKFDVAGARFTLGMIHKRKWEGTGSANDKENASSKLRMAQEQYAGTGDLEGVRRATRELALLGQPVGVSRYLFEQGDYQFHALMRRMAGPAPKGARPSTQLDVMADVGDEAAVIKVRGSGESAESGVQTVISTAAVPGSICQFQDDKRIAYAAQFAVVQAVADMIEIGAVPSAILLNLYLKRDATWATVKKLVGEVRNEAEKYGVVLVGGDLKERQEQSVGCVSVGEIPPGQDAIHRRGGNPGHIVAITLAHNALGGVRKIGTRWAADVLNALNSTKPLVGNLKEVLEEYNRADIKRELLYAPCNEMVAAAATGKVASAMDTSDGVMACLEILARESSAAKGDKPAGPSLAFVLEEDLLESVIDQQVKDIAKALEIHPAQFLFNAGHDWEIVMTVEPENFLEVRNAVQGAGGDLMPLGRMVENTNASGSRCFEREIGVLQKGKSRICRVPLFTDEKFVSWDCEQRVAEWQDLELRGRLTTGAEVQLYVPYKSVAEALGGRRD